MLQRCASWTSCWTPGRLSAQQGRAVAFSGGARAGARSRSTAFQILGRVLQDDVVPAPLYRVHQNQRQNNQVKSRRRPRGPPT